MIDVNDVLKIKRDPKGVGEGLVLTDGDLKCNVSVGFGMAAEWQMEQLKPIVQGIIDRAIREWETREFS